MAGGVLAVPAAFLGSFLAQKLLQVISRKHHAPHCHWGDSPGGSPGAPAAGYFEREKSASPIQAVPPLKLPYWPCHRLLRRAFRAGTGTFYDLAIHHDHGQGRGGGV
jgi:hypothetical protein